MKKLLLLPVLCLCLFSKTFAQLDTSDFSYQLNFIPDQETISGMDTTYFHKIQITLNDTVNVSKIGVKVGTVEGMGDVADYEFVFDKDTFLPKGYAYYREGYQLKLNVGKHSAGNYYYEIRLVDNSSQYTQAKKWNGWSH